MCGSVGQLQSCVQASKPHWTWCSPATSIHNSNLPLVFVGFSGDPSSSLAQPAMAPALTQATHQRQTLTLHPASPTTLSSKLDTLTSPRVVCADESTQHLKQLVWSSHCCGVDVGIGKGRRSKKEIARSEKVSRGDGQATGTALDPPATKSQAPASTTTKTTTQGSPAVAAAAPERTAVATDQPSSVCSEGSNSLDVPVTRCVNGKKTMGLQPIAVSGDRMSADLSSPVPTVIKSSLRSTEWPMSSDKQIPDVPFGPDHQDPSLCLLEGSDPLEADVDDTNVQDILDVINSMEVDPSVVQCGSTTAAAVVDGLDSALNKLTPAEQLLLRQAAAVVLEDSTAVVSKESVAEQKLDEVRSKQQQIEQRCQSLLRRAGRLQSRQVSRHVADQVSNFVQYAKDTLGVKQRDGRTGPNGSNLYGWAEDGRLPTREEVRNIPTATLVNLVSRLQAPPISYLSNRRYFALGTSSSSSGIVSSQCPRNSGTRLNTEVAESLEDVAGQWEAQLRYLQRYEDPDATESSSGGESDDENPVIESQQLQTPSLSSSSSLPIDQSDPLTAPLSNPLHSAAATAPAAGISGTSHSSAANQAPAVKPVSTYQRAAWRWARDRAAIAARWSWLQAQVADLEYRIRQHTDVYRQLRAAKGAVHFGTSGSASTGTSPVKESTSCEPDAETECSASRTRPLTCNGTFRKRRLVRTSILSAPNPPGGGRKIPRHSTVRCCCVLSRIYQPCVLCGGKNNYLLPVDPDGMTIKERIGLVDRGFHPVLSLPQEVPISAHVDSLLKSGDWRTPSTPSQAAGGVNAAGGRRGGKAADDEATPTTKKRTLKRKHSKSLVQDEFVGDQAAGGSKLDRRKVLKRRKRAATSADASSVNELDDSGSGFPPSSPACLSASGDNSTPGRPTRERSMFQDLMRRRTSYDIDNIVIPYSMAATTRVERLQYKEILTPKWRAVEDPSPFSATFSTNQLDGDHEGEEEEETEDVGDEACAARHERSEAEERRKFMSYLKQPAGSARGRSRRVDHILDSRAESSGANTPDQPLSPHDEPSVTPVKFITSASSDNLSGAIKQDKMDSLDAVGEDETMSTTCDTPSFKEDSQSASFSLSAIKERRRTASLTKRSESVWKFLHDDNSAMSWELDEIRTVAPYEPRTFPLPDSVFEEMLNEMPPDDPPSRSEEEANHVGRPSSRSSSSKRETRLSESGAVVDRPPSTNSSSSHTAATLDQSPSIHEDDLNDPEFFPDESKKSA